MPTRSAQIQPLPAITQQPRPPPKPQKMVTPHVPHHHPIPRAQPTNTRALLPVHSILAIVQQFALTLCFPTPHACLRGPCLPCPLHAPPTNASPPIGALPLCVCLPYSGCPLFLTCFFFFCSATVPRIVCQPAPTPHVALPYYIYTPPTTLPCCVEQCTPGGAADPTPL